MPLAPWAAQYVGLPYRAAGRDRTGVDCWGLVRLVMAERYGRTLPSFAGQYDLDAGRASWPVIGETIDAGLADWIPVPRDAAAIGDGVVCAVARHPLHVGLIVGLQPLSMLHVEAGLDTCVERLDSLVWSRRIVGIYRCRP